jgi:PhzF family phenazine biosynthesis protein
MPSNMALQLDFAIIDVFTQKKYEGNPLAIVRVPRACTLSQEQKQTIAREFNLSETTFLHEKDAATGLEWTVDIFTVYSELPFAGHPTIGTACFVLSDMAKECGDQSKVEASFNIKAGRVQLEYDVEARTAKAEIPHNVYVSRAYVV